MAHGWCPLERGVKERPETFGSAWLVFTTELEDQIDAQWCPTYRSRKLIGHLGSCNSERKHRNEHGGENWRTPPIDQGIFELSVRPKDSSSAQGILPLFFSYDESRRRTPLFDGHVNSHESTYFRHYGRQK